MHVSPAKHSYTSVTDGRTDRQTDGRRTKWSLCVAMLRRRHKNWNLYIFLQLFRRLLRHAGIRRTYSRLKPRRPHGRNAPWKLLVIRWRSSSVEKSWNRWKVWSVWSHYNWFRVRMSCNIHERKRIQFLLNKISVSTIKLPEWRFKAFHEVSLFEWLTGKSPDPQNKTFIRETSPGV